MEYFSESRRELEMTIKKVTLELRKMGNIVLADYEESDGGESKDGSREREEDTGKMYLHEFLFLVANALDR